MPNIASILKSEISRVARKELRVEIAAIKKSLSASRTEITALKRQVLELRQELRQQRRVVAKGLPAAAAAKADVPEGAKRGRAVRFSAKGLATQRQRLGLSANDLGLLIGASGQSVYKWEQGKARPRARQMVGIATLKTLGKKSAAARLAALRGTGD